MGRVREEKRREEKRREEKRREERKKGRKKIRKEEDPGARKGWKVAKHCVFPMICGSGGSKSRLAKAAGAEPAGQMRDEKLRAVVTRNTFASENDNTSCSEHFWKLRCRKSARRCGATHISKSKCAKHTSSGPLLQVEMSESARRCGATHISKSKCAKHTSFGPLLEVEMSEKCTPLWREAHFEVKMYKAHQSTPGSDHFWKLRRRKSARGCGAKQISKSKCTKHTRFGHVRTTFGR